MCRCFSESLMSRNCGGEVISSETRNSEILTSWKEIASYIGRGVRTVQRWERQLGLPVRRKARRSTVTALSSEIDAWIAGGATFVGCGHQNETTSLNVRPWRIFSTA